MYMPQVASLGCLLPLLELVARLAAHMGVIFFASMLCVAIGNCEPRLGRFPFRFAAAAPAPRE